MPKPATPRDLGSLDPIHIPYIINGEAYTLEEASGLAVAEFLGQRMDSTNYDDEGNVVSMSGEFLTSKFDMLAKCLRKNSTGELVPVEVLKTWPHRIVSPLMEDLEEISESGYTPDKEEENPTQPDEPSDTPQK